MTRRFSGRTILQTIAFAALLPFGCAIAQENAPLNQLDPAAGFSSVMRTFPSMDAEYSRTGVVHEIDTLRHVAVGQSQSDLFALLGRPAIEHDNRSAEFHLSLPLTRKDRLICQYLVFFDAADKVEKTVWRRPQCVDLALRGSN